MLRLVLVFPSNIISMRLTDGSIFTAKIWAIIKALEEIKNYVASKYIVFTRLTFMSSIFTIYEAGSYLIGMVIRKCLFVIFDNKDIRGAGRSSEVERSLMVRWVVGSILHGVDPLSYFSFQPVLHYWCNKGRDTCYPVCGMVHIKEPLLLIDKSSLCGGSGFPFSLSEWSLTICLTPYNRR